MKLVEKLHISEVDGLAKSLLDLLGSEQSVCIDISDVKDADTASLQALCSLQKSLGLTDSTIQWQGKSEALNDLSKQLGVFDYLKLPT